MSETNESQWINIADVMSALMMIFMFIAIAFLFEILKDQEQKLDKQTMYKINLNKALHDEFDTELVHWKAEITPNNIIRFNSPFKIGQPEIPDNFKSIIWDFFPRYVKVQTKTEFINEIDEIRVEGHTSNVWGKAKQKESYLFNMDLSQKRASNVLKFCYKVVHPIIDKNIFWLQKNLRANGMSFSKLLHKQNGTQDKTRSRRVEFKVVTKEYRVNSNELY